MKVLHTWKGVSARKGAGGGVAMYRLHQALLDEGVQSRVLCEPDSINSVNISHLPRERRRERWLGRFTKALGLNDIHRFSSFGLPAIGAVKRADIVHIHGTHHDFINYLALPKLNRNKPLVFTLHDMWAITGHCAYSYECEKWKTGCGACPRLSEPPKVSRDMTHVEWKLKKWVYENSDITFISPSTHMKEMAQQGLLRDNSVITIPHGLDTSIYRPLNKAMCRDLLGLPRDKHVLMFTAVNISNQRKGGDLLVDALKALPEEVRHDTVIVVLGGNAEGFSSEVGIETHAMGFIESDELKAVLYSAADIFISPTRGEAFGLVVLEAMACGTPVVAYGVGGMLDLIRDGKNGLIAEPQCHADLSRKILSLMEDKAMQKMMQANAVEIVDREYRLDLQAQRHRDVYRSILCV